MTFDWARREYLSSIGSLLGIGLLSERGAGDSEARAPLQQRRTVSLENDHVRVVFDEATGGLRQLTAKETGQTLRNTGAQGQPPAAWLLKFYSDDVAWMQAVSWAAGTPSINVTEGAGQRSATIRWTDPGVFAAGVDGEHGTLSGTVTLTATLRDGEQFVRWNIDIDREDGEYAIREVRYPFVTNVASLGEDEQSALVMPVRMGRRIPNPTDRAESHRMWHPSGFGTMQFLAYTHPDGGFYFDTRDTDGFVKSFHWQQFRSAPALYHGFRSPKESGADIRVPYDVTLGAHQGDWYDAADRYHDWAAESGMLPEESLTTPAWYSDQGAAMWAFSHRREADNTATEDVSFEQTVDGVIEAREALGTPMQFIWWGYQTNGTLGYGDWFPPQEGWQSFRTAIDRLQTKSVAPVGFVNSRKLYKESELYQSRTDELRRWLIRNEDQSVTRTTEQNLTAFFPHLTSDGWWRELLQAQRTWAEEGAKEIWVDGIPWGGQKACYADHHDHPAGDGGNWWAEETKTHLQKTRDELLSIDDSVLLSGEGISDFFLPELDIQHTRDTVIETRASYRESAEIIPLTQYTLGDYLFIRGNNPYQLVDAPYSQSLQYQRLVLARALAWGSLPGFRVRVQDPANLYNEDLFSYLSNIAEVFRLHGSRFINDGRMLRPPEITSGQIEVTAAISQSGGGGTRTTTTPRVHVSAWESETGNERAVILTNISENTVIKTVPLDSHPFDQEGDRLFYSVKNGRYKPVQTTDSHQLEVTLAQDDVLIVVSAPDTEDRRAALSSLVEAQNNPSVITKDELVSVQEAFVTAEYDQTVALAEDQRDESSTTTSQTAQSETDPRTRTQNTSETATNSTTPGFGLMSAIGGLGSTAYLLKRRLSEKEE